MCPWLVCCLCVCHDLKARLHILLLVLDFLWCEWVSEPSFFMSHFLPRLDLAWLWDFPSLICSLPLFTGLLALLPCHSIISVVLLFDPYLLGLFWAYCMFFLFLILVAQYYYWASIHAVLGFLGPFHCFWASLAHFISLGILGPFHFLRHPRPIPILYSYGPLIILLGFPDTDYHILYSWGLWAFLPTPYSLNSLLWASLAYPCLLFTSHNAHRFATSFFGLLWARLLSLRPFCYFLSPMVYYSCHLGLMVFFLIY